MELLKKENVNIKSYFCDFPTSDLTIMENKNNGVFILNKNWKTFKDVKKDFDILSNKPELKNVSICLYDLNTKSECITNIEDDWLDDFSELLFDNHCREFEPEFDKELLDEFVVKMNETIKEVETGKTYEDIVIRDRYNDFIEEQTSDYNKMLEKYNKLKKNQILYIHNDPVDLYPDYNYSGVAEVNELKIQDLVDADKYGFNLHTGILIKVN